MLVAEAPFGGIAPDDNFWNSLLTGASRPAVIGRGILARLPSAPRCKLCRAPAGGWGGAISSLLGRRVDRELLLCHHCLDIVDARPGGAAIEATVIHGNLRSRRGEPSNESAYGFLRLAAEAIDREQGFLDSFKDGAFRAFFIATVGGPNHPERANAALAELYRAGNESGLFGSGVELAAGFATGTARAGTVGRGGAVDFTVTGDPVETAERLAAAAADGEALVALDSWRRYAGSFAKSRLRSVPIPGRLQPVEAVIIRGRMEATI